MYKRNLNDVEREMIDDAVDAMTDNYGQFFKLVYDADTSAGAKLLFESDTNRFWVTLRMRLDGTIETKEFSKL